MNDQPARPVVALLGSGAMGLSAVRRLGSGRHVVLADYSPDRLDEAAGRLADEGHSVEQAVVDVRDRDSVAAVAESAARRGTIEAVVHTAGVSPSQASSRDVFAIDLVGTAHVIDAFWQHAGPGTSLVCVASMAGYKTRLDADLERLLATAPTEELLAIPGLDLDCADTSAAYDVAKRGVQVRVAAQAARWGARGARINSVSPGIVATPMSRREFERDSGEFMRGIVARQPVSRLGTPEDVGAAIAFLCSNDASYITGTDLLVDGGTVSTWHWLGAPTA